MKQRLRDLLLGSVVGAFAIAYIGAARSLEDSLLADAVGAGGVPQAAGVVLLLTSLTLIGKALLARGDTGAGEAVNARSQQLGGTLLALLVVYVFALPVLGYTLAVSLLVGAVAWLAGARDRVALALCTALSGVAMWAMFEWALKIRMPSGSLFG